MVESSMVGDGCIIQPGCTISNSVVGLRSKIFANTIIEDSLLMGTDYYERPEDCELAAHCLPMGIGANSCAFISSVPFFHPLQALLNSCCIPRGWNWIFFSCGAGPEGWFAIARHARFLSVEWDGCSILVCSGFFVAREEEVPGLLLR